MKIAAKVSIFAGLVLLVVIALFLIFNLYEIREREISVPPDPEVTRDPYFAIEKIVSQEAPVIRYHPANEIDLERAGAIVMDAALLDYYEAAEIVHWIERGGRLFLLFEYRASVPDRDMSGFLTRFSGFKPDFDPYFHPENRNKSLRKGVGSTEKETSIESVEAIPRFGEIPIGEEGPGVMLDLSISFPDADQIALQEITKIGSVGRTHAIVAPLGLGFVFVSARPEFMINQNLRVEGNRTFAGVLWGRLDELSGEVWLPAPPIIAEPTIVPIDTGPLIISGLGLCLLFFWRMLPRFGPMIPEARAGNRSIRESLLAEGRFLRRHRAGQAMLVALRAGTSIHDPQSLAVQHRDVGSREFVSMVAEYQKRGSANREHAGN